MRDGDYGLVTASEIVTNVELILRGLTRRHFRVSPDMQIYRLWTLGQIVGLIDDDANLS